MSYRGWKTTPSGPQTVHRQIAAGAGDLSPRPFALFCQAAGDVTMTDEKGTSLTYTLAQGQILPFAPVKITAATATVYGLYDA